MPTVEIPGVGNVEFPDTMKPDEITAAAKNLHTKSAGGSPANPMVAGDKAAPMQTSEGFPFFQKVNALFNTPIGTDPDKPAKGAVMNALKPITDYPATYARVNEEARGKVGTGLSEIAGGQIKKGAWDTGLGALDYISSPVQAGLHTIVGDPLEKNFGIPHQQSEFAASLAIPYYGLRGGAPGAKTAEKIFSPESVSPVAEEAAGLVRQRGGMAARDTEVQRAALEGHTKVLSGLSDAERLNFIDYLEGGGRAPIKEEVAKVGKIKPEDYDASLRAATSMDSTVTPIKARTPEGAARFAKEMKWDDLEAAWLNRAKKAGKPISIPPELEGTAGVIRDAYSKIRTKLESLPSSEQMSFVENYYPHLWKDPKKAAAFYRGTGAREGSGSFTKQRSIPTVAEGIKAGLEPANLDPIATTMQYVDNANRFIATNEVFDIARNKGTVKYFQPGRQPDGWVEVEGRLGRKMNTTAYAPKDWARIYNNFVSKGFHGARGGEFGEAYDVLRRGSNAVTALELGLSGYHALTMAQEGIVNQVAKAVGETVRGVGKIGAGDFKEGIKQVGRGARAAATAPIAPAYLAYKGKKLQGAYLGAGSATPEMKQIADLLAEVGGRAKGIGHSPDYEFSGMRSYFTSFKRGTLKTEMLSDLKDLKGNPMMRAAPQAARQIGRIMTTVAQPIFEKYIPLIKDGAFYENMGAYLKAHPNATHEELLAAGRKIWDSVDNRFGEMVQDNIFWNKTLKQTAMLSMLSYSWTLGTMREIGGGIRDVGRASAGSEWTDKMSYVVALPLVTGALNAAYQYMKTGQGPQDIQDLMHARTGGVDPTGKPERMQLPGYMKEVYGWAEHPEQEALNKISPFIQRIKETASIADGLGGNDWRGDPILSPPKRGAPWAENVPQWMQEYFTHVIGSSMPISGQTLERGQKRGSNINQFETVLGLKPTGQQFTDPEKYRGTMESIRDRRWKAKQKHDAKDKGLYGGPDE